jgi:hypothetical protein
MSLVRGRWAVSADGRVTRNDLAVVLDSLAVPGGVRCVGDALNYVHPHDRERVRHWLERVISGRVCGRWEARLRCGDGVYRWATSTCWPVHRDGEYRGIEGETAISGVSDSERHRLVDCWREIRGLVTLATED